MPAPAITFNRGSVTHTLDPVPKNGWEIRGTVTQAAIGADWVGSLSIVKVDLAAINDNDETATSTAAFRIPFNEAPSESAMIAEVQAKVDHIFDNDIPSPV